MHKNHTLVLPLFLPFLLLAACTGSRDPLAACPVTEPERLTPPEDEAVSSAPAEGWYYANADGSILAAAWWFEGWLAEDEPYPLTAGSDGIKTGWFRPTGATLTITGGRLDGDAPPLDAHVPCCYPTRFQAAGLIFPTEGCWEVQAEAGGKTLTFTVWVDP